MSIPFHCRDMGQVKRGLDPPAYAIHSVPQLLKKSKSAGRLLRGRAISTEGDGAAQAAAGFHARGLTSNLSPALSG